MAWSAARPAGHAGHADTPIRRYADTPIRRYADTPIRRYADTPIRRRPDPFFGIEARPIACKEE